MERLEKDDEAWHHEGREDDDNSNRHTEHDRRIDEGGGERRSSLDIALYIIGKLIKDKKIVIGVVDHHTLQVERPDEVAALIREALKHIPPERLIISSDCGMGREGMSRRHATYKMVAMVLGTNIVRKELGLAEAPCLAADPRYSLTLTKT